MFEETEKPVEESTENVEELATEELVDGTSEQVEDEPKEKLYTEEEFNKKLDEVLAKKIARKEDKLRREYNKKYGRLENVLKAGTGEEDIDNIADAFTDFYTNKGVQIPAESNYTERDIERLAKGDAEDIIDLGMDEVIEEVDRLANIGVENMTSREKIMFTKLADYRKTETSKKELASIGVDENQLKDEEYIEFKKDLNPNMSEKEMYEKFLKYKPKPKVETMGSMAGNISKDTGVKDFYTRDEALMFTKEDFDKNPELFKAVENSMTKWLKT